MDKEILNVPVDGVVFHCERMGKGPSVLLIPDGCNDCGPYEKLMVALAKEFTVLTFDMRGGSRSPDPSPQTVTPKRLADDVAGIVNALGMSPVSAYGCSSGAQTVLALGKYHPGICRNLMVHEAALQADTPLPNAGFRFFQMMDVMKEKIHPDVGLTWDFADYDGFMALGPDCHARMQENAKFWAEYYCGTVDMDSYSAEDLKAMPPVDFTVGVFSPSWLTQANLSTAARGDCLVTWLYSGHHPETSCTEDLAAQLRKTIHKYL